MKPIKHLSLAFFSTIMILDGCSSGKVAFEHGNYYQAVMTSVDRLRRNSDHKKSVETLRQAYPLAVSYFEDRAKTSLASNAEFKWTAVVESYTMINNMYDEIRRSPGALAVIPNPVNYYAKLEEARKNAAEENYAAGVNALAVGTRDKAKQAYGLFKTANGFVPGYKDVIKMMEAALWAATVKVVVDPIPSPSANVNVSAEFFNNKISEFVHTASVNEFVKFYSRNEAQNLKINPDHIIELKFDEFSVGQVFLYEREIQLQNDSVVVGTYVDQSTKTPPVTDVPKPTDDKKTQDTKENTDVITPVTGGNTDKKESETVDPKKEETKTPDDKTQEEKKADGQPQTGKNEDKSEKDKKEGEIPVDTIAKADQVTICHVPPGNEANRHTLTISRSALDAHLKHGDVLGSCEDAKNKGEKPKDDKQKKPDEKKPDEKKGKGGGGMASFTIMTTPVLLASRDEFSWLNYVYQPIDTTKVYSTVKATLYYSKKTTTSKGVVSFRIIDAKTKALLSVEKLPGEYVWISEWATFNGDERALTAEQLQLCKKKELIPPPAQDLFVEFTRPIYDQVTQKIKDFYKGY